MKKRTVCFLSMLLVISMMAVALAGCGQTAPLTSAQPEESAATQETAQPTQEQTVPPEETEAPAEPEPSTEPEAALVEYELPLTDKDVSYEWFIMNNALLGKYPDHDEWNDCDAVRHLSDITGVDIQMVGVTDGSARLNLLLASGDYPDVISGFGVYYPGGYDQAIEESIILDLNDYLDIMPNYSYYLNQYEELFSQAHTDTGALWGCARFSIDEAAANGFVIRRDWLDEQKLELPQTLSQLENTLTVFKTAYSTAENGPMLMYNTGCFSGFGMSYAFNNSFNIGIVGALEGSPFINKDGEVIFTPATENWYKYLEVVSDWYEKGLVYQDFSAIGLMDTEPTFFEGKVGVMEAGYLTMNSLKNADGEPACVGIQFPLNDINGESEEIHVGPHTNTVDKQYSVCVSAQAEEPEILLTFLDYLYSEEGRIISSYGIEGVTYEVDETGEPHFTEFVTNNPDGYSVDVVRVAYSFKTAPTRWNWSLEESMSTYTQTQHDARRLWDAYDDAYVMPPVTLTTEESEAAQSAYGDMLTYIAEYDLKVIAGDSKLADTWDEYIATLESMGYKSVTKVYQAALDRYLAR